MSESEKETSGFKVPWGSIVQIGMDLGAKLIKAGIEYWTETSAEKREAIKAQSRADTDKALADMFELHKLQDEQNAEFDKRGAAKPDKPPL